MLEVQAVPSPASPEPGDAPLTKAAIDVLAAREELRRIHDAEAGLLPMDQRLAIAGVTVDQPRL